MHTVLEIHVSHVKSGWSWQLIQYSEIQELGVYVFLQYICWLIGTHDRWEIYSKFKSHLELSYTNLATILITAENIKELLQKIKFANLLDPDGHAHYMRIMDCNTKNRTSHV